METSVIKKKILYLITKSNFGGAQRYVFELALAMQERGYEVAVACGGQGELVSRLKEVNIQTFEIESFQRDINLFQELKALFSLVSIIRNFKPDIIHTNSSKAGLLGSFVARLARVPRIVFTAHGWPFLEPRKLLWRIMAWTGSYLTAVFSHKVILVSNYDFAHTRMPGVKSKSTVLHTAVEEFSLLPREKARISLLPPETITNHFHNIWLVSTGELNHNKNHEAAINAVAEFNSTHTTKIFYVIIGEGDLLSSLKEQTELKGLGEYIYFKGYVKDIRYYLQAFDMFLMPSKKEGLPLGLLEVGFAGLPCIASKVGGIPEVITDRKSGLLINPENHMSIVEALDYLLNNPDKRSAYSENLSRHIKENFNHSSMIEKTANIYAL